VAASDSGSGGEHPIRRGFADTPEGQVLYAEAGAGEPLMLLHQSPRSSSMYLDLLPLLAPAHRAIAMDMLGYGLSPALPVVDGRGDVLDVARNVVSVLDALEIERCHVFGFHTGAQVAAQVAANWPDRLGALILGGFGFRVGDDAGDFYAAMAVHGPIPKQSYDGSHLTRLWMKAYSEVLKWWLIARNPPHDADAPALITGVSPHRAIHTFLTDAELTFMDRYIIDALRSRSVHALYQSTISTDPHTVLPRITAPTLHVAPDSPHESPYAMRGERVVSLLPHGEAVTLPQSDDNLVEFRTADLAELILGFLSAHPITQPAVGAGA
jgi:pimeloyl-ACP methyl ester carboxylesterase